MFAGARGSSQPEKTRVSGGYGCSRTVLFKHPKNSQILAEVKFGSPDSSICWKTVWLEGPKKVIFDKMPERRPCCIIRRSMAMSPSMGRTTTSEKVSFSISRCHPLQTAARGARDWSGNIKTWLKIVAQISVGSPVCCIPHCWGVFKGRGRDESGSVMFMDGTRTDVQIEMSNVQGRGCTVGCLEQLSSLGTALVYRRSGQDFYI